MTLYLITTTCKNGSRRLLFKEIGDAWDYAKHEYKSGDYEEIWMSTWITTEYGPYGSCKIGENFQMF